MHVNLVLVAHPVPPPPPTPPPHTQHFFTAIAHPPTLQTFLRSTESYTHVSLAAQEHLPAVVPH